MHNLRHVRVVRVVLWLLCVPMSAGAQDASSPPSAHGRPGDQLTVYLATFGQGDLVFEKFGHNAIWIHDALTGTTTAYHYGVFDFDQPGFVPRLMKGRMLYQMGIDTGEDQIAAYRYFNRSIWLQRLNLLPQQRDSLRVFLEWNWLEQNRHYLYHYFYDNCSTRLRDALDRALGGVLRTQLAGKPTGTTYRWHSLRLTGASLPVSLGLSLGLGKPTDVPIDAWEESFIPMELMAHARDVRVTGANGEQLPLVAEERNLFEADRAAEAAEPPTVWPFLLGFSCLLGAGIVLLGRRGRTRQRAALTLSIWLSLWGVVVGFFGLILALLWTATDHTTSYNNHNLLLVNPLGFLLAVAAPLAVLKRSGGPAHRIARLAWPTALTLLALATVALLLRLIPAVAQVNGPIIALVLPLHVATVLSLYQAAEPDLSLREDVTARMPPAAAA